jgi:hypothetical protein
MTVAYTPKSVYSMTMECLLVQILKHKVRGRTNYLRIKTGYSINAISKKAGYSPRLLHDFLSPGRHRTGASTEMHEKLAFILGVPADTLIREDVPVTLYPVPSHLLPDDS